ncbi:hypothetical protein L1887_02989 [Cichorium endivia]|nr:hypothetical protein L1887_02989 [Cichorium endivia]
MVVMVTGIFHDRIRRHTVVPSTGASPVLQLIWNLHQLAMLDYCVCLGEGDNGDRGSATRGSNQHAPRIGATTTIDLNRVADRRRQCYRAGRGSWVLLVVVDKGRSSKGFKHMEGVHWIRLDGGQPATDVSSGPHKKCGTIFYKTSQPIRKRNAAVIW